MWTNWGSCTKIQNPKPPSFSPKQNPQNPLSKIILKNLIPNSEEKTHSKTAGLLGSCVKKKASARNAPERST